IRGTGLRTGGWHTRPGLSSTGEEPEFPRRAAGAGSSSLLAKPIRRSVPGGGSRSALALLVAQVVADHHDPPVTADHLALLAGLLDARLNLHVCPICCGFTGV